MRFLTKWLINSVALFVVVNIVAGVGAENWQAVVAAAFIIGLFNAFLKPLVILLTLPINIMSLGFFTLIINAFFFYLASKFVKGFTVMDFWSAFWAAIVFSVISFILNMMLSPKAGFSFRSNIYTGHDRSEKYSDAIDVEATVGGKSEGMPENKIENKGGSL